MLPPLYINQGLMKNFINALGKERHAFKYLNQIILKLCDDTFKEEIFVVAQIRKIIREREKKRFVAKQNGKKSRITCIRTTCDLKIFPENLGTLSDHQRERYLHDILTIE